MAVISPKRIPLPVPRCNTIVNEVGTGGPLGNPGQFFQLPNLKETRTSQFAWADPAMKSILEIQLIPITLMLFCQIIIKGLNDDYVFAITVGWGMYLPPIYLFSYIIGSLTNYRTSYFTISFCLAVMALTVYASISIMINDVTHLLQYLVFLQDNVHPIAIWTPWTIIFICNVTLLIFSATFTVMSLVDMHRFRPESNNDSAPSASIRPPNSSIVFLVPPRQTKTDQIV